MKEEKEAVFPEAWMNELMSRNDIVSVVSEYTHLTSRGSRMWAYCPFHPERNPSFTVSPDKQLFHCFSCKAGGSVIQFIMQAENLPYIDAVRFLAQRAGMEMPNVTDDENLRKQKALRDRLYKANVEAARYYHAMLMGKEGLRARKYLIDRGIDGNTAVKFGLGYAPRDWDALFRYMIEKGYTVNELISAGLCTKDKRHEDHAYDFFKDRLIFPIIAATGSVIAFGGRILTKEGGPKYLNTGDTLIYNKKHNVYGINLMKGKRLNELIMVEGYMDVLTLHQYGIDNAVASLGTALTSRQVRLMSRFAKRAYFAYDGDAAGQNAMLRGVDILNNNGIEARVIVIPEERDPDEFIRSFGSEAFLKLKDSAVTAVRFKLDTIEKAQDMASADGRENYAKKACALISPLEPVERERYIKYISERSGMNEAVIASQCGQPADEKTESETKQAYSSNNPYRRPQRQSKRKKAEIMLLACLSASKSANDAVRHLKGFSENLFSDPSLAAFADKVTKAYEQSAQPDMRMLIAGLDSAESEGASAAIAQIDSIDDHILTAQDCIKSIFTSRYDEKIRSLAQQCKKETDPEKRTELLKQQMELMKKSRGITDE